MIYKKMKLKSGLLVVLGCLCSTALGLDFMGPPTAELEKGQFGLGADYADTRMDLGLDKGVIQDDIYQHGALATTNSTRVTRFTLKRLKMHKLYANVSYGITDNWEAFIRLGGMNTEFEGNFFSTTSSQVRRYNGDTGFAIGFGTKVTLYEKDKLKFGGLFQMSWASSDASLSYSGTREEIELDITEMQIALGITYKLSEKWTIYGGPFWHFIKFKNSKIKGHKNPTIDPSQAEQKISHSSYDIDDIGHFGGYIGARYEIFKDTFYCIEYQHTRNADALAMSVRWKF